MSRQYEIGFIMNPESTEEEVKKVIDSITQIIVKSNGKVESVDEWGRRKFQYPIEKHREGLYVFINANSDGSDLIEVERRLKLTEKVMRFLVLRIDDKLKKANRLVKKWKRMEKGQKKSQPPRERVETPAPAPAPKPAETAPKKEETDEK